MFAPIFSIFYQYREECIKVYRHNALHSPFLQGLLQVHESCHINCFSQPGYLNTDESFCSLYTLLLMYKHLHLNALRSVIWILGSSGKTRVALSSLQFVTTYPGSLRSFRYPIKMRTPAKSSRRCDRPAHAYKRAVEGGVNVSISSYFFTNKHASS